MNDKKFVKIATSYYESCLGSALASAKKKYPNILTGFTGYNSYSYNLYEVVVAAQTQSNTIKNTVKLSTDFSDERKNIICYLCDFINCLTPQEIMYQALNWNSALYISDPTIKKDVMTAVQGLLSGSYHLSIHGNILDIKNKSFFPSTRIPI